MSSNNIAQLCRSNQWKEVLECLKQDPSLALQPIFLNNHLVTSIAHQAISEKGDIESRMDVLDHILTQTPKAAEMKNGYGSLPIHVCAQRNTKLKAKNKEHLILRLLEAYPGSTTVLGGVGKRSPVHVIFTDYISAKVCQTVVSLGEAACFMKDKNGYLPAHVACSRHCSPTKLQMLLEVNPDALFDKTNSGDTLLSLAKGPATANHPNHRLIEAIEGYLVASHRNSMSVMVA